MPAPMSHFPPRKESELSRKGEDLPRADYKSEHAQRVLVVDDNLDSADSLAILLRFLGHEVRTAFDGLEAVNAALEFQPTIMLLDIGLPKLNGYEVARQVRAQPEGNRIKLIALTGWGQAEDMRRSREAGFDLHLVKPVSMADLRRLMAERRPSNRAGE
jgi:CheY-like chemotaxis protein